VRYFRTERKAKPGASPTVSDSEPARPKTTEQLSHSYHQNSLTLQVKSNNRYNKIKTNEIQERNMFLLRKRGSPLKRLT